MAVPITALDTGHSDVVHDSQFDYYGRKLATCSSDGLVRIFSVDGEQTQHLADLQGHSGPVWQVAWGHPKYGNLLASCSFDHTVIVWKEDGNAWQIAHKTDPNLHTGSINSVAWAPYELGLLFACASSDGIISVHMYNQASASWGVSVISSDGQPAHPMGATAVSFAPAVEAGALVSARGAKAAGPACRLASAGCDNAVRLWTCGQDGVWRPEGRPLVAHTDWVRDVQWAPNLGLPRSTLASCGQDGKVIAWTEDASSPGVWKSNVVKDYTRGDHRMSVWSVSWSLTGNVLAVSASGATDADSTVELFKEAVDGVWEAVGPAV